MLRGGERVSGKTALLSACSACSCVQEAGAPFLGGSLERREQSPSLPAHPIGAVPPPSPERTPREQLPALPGGFPGGRSPSAPRCAARTGASSEEAARSSKYIAW